MTKFDHNNASETSGEAKIVGKLWAMHGIAQSSENGFTYLNDAARVLVGEAAETINRLVVERDAFKRNIHEMRKLRNVQWKRALDAEKRIAELEADLQRAREALEPFARAALGVGTVWADDLKLNHPEVDHVLPLITVGDLRRAALKGKKP